MLYLGKDDINEANFFYNKRCVITGTFAKYSRDEMTEYIESQGGKVSGSVSKKTDYVIVGENPGSKETKAKELGVTILNEEEYYEIVDKNKGE